MAFAEGWGVQAKKPSVGGVWIFSGTTQCANTIEILHVIFYFPSFKHCQLLIKPSQTSLLRLQQRAFVGHISVFIF